MTETGEAATTTPPPGLSSGAALYDVEVARRRELLHRPGKGPLKTGCPELDEALLGGFERGSVVGVSAEDVDLGVLVSQGG